MNAETYKEAAQEHVATARLLLDAERYVGAFYFAGLAMECIFRAYRFRITPEFDSRRDLYDAWKASKFADAVPEGERQAMSEALEQVVERWSNNHRVRSEDELRWWARRAGLYRLRGRQTLRGNVLAYNGRILMEAAAYLVGLGVKGWERQSQKEG